MGDCALPARGLRGQRRYSLSAGTGVITQYQKINAALAQASGEAIDMHLRQFGIVAKRRAPLYPPQSRFCHIFAR